MSALGVFVLLLLISAIAAYRRRTAEFESRKLIEKMYSSDKIKKMEYDFVVYDKETERIIANNEHIGSQMTIEEIVGDGRLFDKIESEGIEEITGNYKPE